MSTVPRTSPGDMTKTFAADVRWPSAHAMPWPSANLTHPAIVGAAGDVMSEAIRCLEGDDSRCSYPPHIADRFEQARHKTEKRIGTNIRLRLGSRAYEFL